MVIESSEQLQNDGVAKRELLPCHALNLTFNSSANLDVHSYYSNSFPSVKSGFSLAENPIIVSEEFIGVRPIVN
jgi:hypothetical protein